MTKFDAAIPAVLRGDIRDSAINTVPFAPAPAEAIPDSDQHNVLSPETGGNAVRALFRHYIEALILRRRPIILFAVVTALAVMAVSIVLLFAAPKYTAQAAVTMLPSDSELQFTQNWIGRSRIDPVTISTQTHLEYLYSRPVLEQTLDNVLAHYDTTPATGWRAAIADSLSALSSFAWKTYQVANYGKAIEVPERDQQLADLKAGITITPMMASYILLIEASFPDPNLSALVANELARAYVERNAEDSNVSANALKAFLDREIGLRQAELNAASTELVSLERDTPAFDVAPRLAPGLKSEQAELDAAQSKLDDLRAQIAAGDRSAATLELETAQMARVAQLAESLAQSRAREREAEQTQERINDLGRRTAVLSAELAQLRDRRLMIDLSTADAVTRIQIIDPARPPLFPSSPKVLNATVTALIASLILAFTAMMTHDLFSDRVTTPQQLVGITRRPALGTLRPSQLSKPGTQGEPSRRALDMAKVILRSLDAYGTKSPLRLQVVSLGDNSQDDSAVETLRRGLVAAGCRVRMIADDSGFEQVYAKTLPIIEKTDPGRLTIVIFQSNRLPPAGSAAGGALLAVLPAARVSEDDVAAFAQTAEASGAAPIWYLMTESA